MRYNQADLLHSRSLAVLSSLPGTSYHLQPGYLFTQWLVDALVLKSVTRMLDILR